MQPKAKTLIERLGFSDSDRKGSSHDQIQLWAYNNMESIIKQLTYEDKSVEVVTRILEYPISYRERNYFMVVGYADLLAQGKIYNSDGTLHKHFRACFEIKKSIDSCGDLIRQINFYRAYEPFSATWIVISPDDRFASVLREQMIYFIKSPAAGVHRQLPLY